MILVIYHPAKAQFMAFIPNDQVQFFNAFKKIIADQKKHQMLQQQQQNRVGKIVNTLSKYKYILQGEKTFIL